MSKNKKILLVSLLTCTLLSSCGLVDLEEILNGIITNPFNSSTNRQSSIEPEEGYYIITFKFNNGEEDVQVKVEERDRVDRPNDPYKKGYEFIGWYYNNELFDFNTRIRKSITLTAQYQKNASTGQTISKYDFGNSLFEDGLMSDGPLTEGVLPSKMTNNKNPSILVFPVRLSSNYNSSTYDKYLEDIEKTFIGDSYSTGWESVRSYYFQSSYGSINFNITVWDEWFYDSAITTTKLQKYYDSYYNGTGDIDPNEYLLTKVLDRYDSQIDYSKYDSNNDSYIDAIWFVYDTPVNFEDSDSMFWAYCSTSYEWYDESYEDYVNPSKSRDGVYSLYYAWAGVDFMYPNPNTGNYDTDNLVVDAHTFIHETGHLMGLDDYYDYNENSGANTGVYGADMMDSAIGDHCSISKLLLGWVQPYYAYNRGKYTLELESFTISGDCILISDGQINSIYSSYYLVEYYTNDGLNSDDTPIPDGDGIRIFKVNAELNYVNGVVDYNDGNYVTSFKYDNSDTNIPFVEMLSNDKIYYDQVSYYNLINEDQSFENDDIIVENLGIINGKVCVEITIK